MVEKGEEGSGEGEGEFIDGLSGICREILSVVSHRKCI